MAFFQPPHQLPLGRMTEDPQGRRRSRRKTWLALSALAVILALLIVPPYISVSRYKNRITQAMSASIGRPVRLSSIELRLLPRPSFVLADLAVEEDPAYGSEPVLHANSVTAAIRILPLWRGRLEISRISVDEALRVNTINGAYASFEEKFKGSITPGKLADFVVLSKDVLTPPSAETLSSKVLLTVMGGKDTYRNEDVR